MLKSADVKLWLTKSFKDPGLQFSAFESSALLKGHVLFLAGVLAGLGDVFTGSIHTHWISLEIYATALTTSFWWLKSSQFKANFCFALA